MANDVGSEDLPSWAWDIMTRWELDSGLTETDIINLLDEAASELRRAYRYSIFQACITPRNRHRIVQAVAKAKDALRLGTLVEQSDLPGGLHEHADGTATWDPNLVIQDEG